MKDKLNILLSQIREEKWLLLLCFILAFLSWQGIRKNIGFEVSVSNIAVDVDAPEGWAVWEKSVHRVNILFRGSREDIRYLNNEQLRVVIPISDPEGDEERVVKLTKAYVRNPTGAKVVRFSPSEIIVKLDQEGERLLPVKAAVKGSLPDGLDVETIICTPASVRVSGARKVLDEMEYIQTEPLDLSERQTTFRESVPVALPQAGRMQVVPDWVSVELMVKEHNSIEVFEKVPVRALCAPGERRRIDVQPQFINVTVKGRQQRIEQLRSSDIFAYVSCYDLTESTSYDLPAVVDLPTGLQLVKSDPAVVHVVVGNAK
jgi:YbbR domain-containing protein